MNLTQKFVIKTVFTFNLPASPLAILLKKFTLPNLLFFNNLFSFYNLKPYFHSILTSLDNDWLHLQVYRFTHNFI